MILVMLVDLHTCYIHFLTFIFLKLAVKYLVMGVGNVFGISEIVCDFLDFSCSFPSQLSIFCFSSAGKISVMKSENFI